MAARLYRAALRFAPGNSRLWVQLGHMHKEQGELAEAKSAYLKAVETDHHSADAYLHLGHLYNLLHEPASAQAAYQRTLDLSSLQGAFASWFKAEAHLSLGNLGRDSSDWNRAAYHYRRSVEGQREGNAPVWIQLGHALKEGGHIEDAEEAYRTAARLDPTSADALLHLGHVFSVQSLRVQAVEAYAAAVRLKSDFDDAHYALLAAVGYSPAEFDRYVANRALPETNAARENVQAFSPAGPSLAENDANHPAFIWLSNIDWHFRYQRPQHLSAALADAGARILYISIIFDEADSDSFRTVGCPHERIREVRVGFPGGQHAWASRALDRDQSRRISAAIRMAMAAYRVIRPIVVVEEPNWGAVATDLSADLLVYDCVDKLAGFDDVPQSRLIAESLLLERADAVVVTSETLAKEMSAWRPVLIRNGVNPSHFNLPPRLPKARTEPILGYYGALREWLAMDWIVHCARRHPAWTFWLIGRKECNFPEAESMPNIIFKGEQPYERLVGYLDEFDVALIPFKRNELTIATNPVKLYEYLAAGKPVVATDLPEMADAGKLIYSVRDATAFEAGIVAALKENSANLILSRVAWAEKQSWASRAQQLIALVEQRTGGSV